MQISLINLTNKKGEKKELVLKLCTRHYMKKLPVCPSDRQIVSIERVYTPSTFYMKSAVC